jgi:hypothetical protein
MSCNPDPVSGDVGLYPPILVPGCRPDGLNPGLMAGIPPGCTVYEPDGFKAISRWLSEATPPECGVRMAWGAKIQEVYLEPRTFNLEPDLSWPFH